MAMAERTPDGFIQNLDEAGFQRVVEWSMNHIRMTITSLSSLMMLWKFGGLNERVLTDPQVVQLTREETDVMLVYVMDHWEELVPKANKWLEDEPKRANEMLLKRLRGEDEN